MTELKVLFTGMNGIKGIKPSDLADVMILVLTQKI